MGNERGYQEDDVVQSLRRKADLRVVGRQIQELKKGKGDVGIKSRGKIDFLVKYRGYSHFLVDDFKN